ncbi:MAG TPA: gliding motility protein GldM [Cytophagales bacterium]|nr:gliding motility protein GldM [Cytophagales bacterium]
MAGGQMSPRQKMINLMYLVLIAMLALNVDTAVLEKFVLINQSFENTNAEKVTDNIDKVEAIRAAVEDSGNRSEDLKVLEKAEQVRADARVILTYMNQIKDSIANMTGGKDKNGKYKGYTDTDAISRFMVKLGNGDTLKIRLNNYSSFIADEIFEDTSSVHNLARDASEIDIYRDDESFGHLPFKELNFGYNTPMVGGLASISQLQSDLINLEVKALEKLAAAVGAADLKFDVVTLTALPDQKVVAAGAKYRTQLFLSAASSSITPEMSAAPLVSKDGGKTWEIALGDDDIPKIDTLDVTNGRGNYEFTAKASGYDREGLSQQRYIGSISVTLPGGMDTTFQDTITYYVARPVIQVQSGAVQALYRNCGNPLQINVPALGAEYNPTFTATGASLIGGRGGKVTVVPTGNSVSLRVSNSGLPLGTEKFNVRDIPSPKIVVTKGPGCANPKNACGSNRLVSLKDGLPAAESKINIDVIPDKDFFSALPDEGQYRVVKLEVLLYRNGQPLGAVRRVNSRTVNLSSLYPDRKRNDQLRVQVIEVKRANFQDNVEDVTNYAPNFFSITLQ